MGCSLCSPQCSPSSFPAHLITVHTIRATHTPHVGTVNVWAAGKHDMQLGFSSKAFWNPISFTVFWDEWYLISSFLSLQMSSLKVSRCSHTNGSVAIQGGCLSLWDWGGVDVWNVSSCPLCESDKKMRNVFAWDVREMFMRYRGAASLSTSLRVCIFFPLSITFGTNTAGYPLFWKSTGIYLSTFVSGRWRVKQNVGAATTSNEDEQGSPWRTLFSFQVVFNQTAEGLGLWWWLRSSYF